MEQWTVFKEDEYNTVNTIYVIWNTDKIHQKDERVTAKNIPICIKKRGAYSRSS